MGQGFEFGDFRVVDVAHGKSSEKLESLNSAAERVGRGLSG
jgi:hypothetical protein